jgi:hypothetical protein
MNRSGSSREWRIRVASTGRPPLVELFVSAPPVCRHVRGLGLSLLDGLLAVGGTG